MNVEIARRTLRIGFRAGFALGCGAVTVDVTYAVLSRLSLGPLVRHPAVQWPLGIAGFLLLVYLGVQSLRTAQGHLETDPLSDGQPIGSARGAYRTGVLMTLLNPITLLFWFVEVPAQSVITQDRHHDLPMMCAGVFIGTFGWVIVFSGFLGWLGRWRRKWWLAAADRLGGIMLLGLAIYGLWLLVAHTL